MQTVTYELPKLLKQIRNRTFTIPQFQRPFTWRESQVKLLIDSIARNYPVGSVLLMAKTPELSLQSRSIEAVIRDGYPPDSILDRDTTDNSDTALEVYYILDGQQRLTSIARVFLNAHPAKTYYFDLRMLLESFEDEGTTWIKSRARGKTDPDRKDNNRLLRTDIILDQQKTDVYVTEYIEDSGDFPQFVNDKTAARKAAAKIKGVFEAMRRYQVPSVILDRDTGVESVCRVFETINSTGTRLTTFDLAVARYFPSPNLRELWEKSFQELPILQSFEVDGERILQTLALVYATQQRRYSEPSRSELLNLPAKFINDNWDRASKVLAYAYNWAGKNGARPETIPSHGIIVAIAAFFFLYPNIERTDHSFNDMLRRWYFCNVLQQGARQAANYRIGVDYTNLVRYGQDRVLPSFAEVRLSVEILQNLTQPQDVRYKAIQCLLASTIQKDLLTGGNMTADSVIEDHHIFPRSLRKQANNQNGLSQIDSVANRIPILRDSNRELNDTPPAEYFALLRDSARRNGTFGELVRRMQACLIPSNPSDENWLEGFTNDNFSEFLYKRAELILERIREIVGESLATTLTEGEDDTEID